MAIPLPRSAAQMPYNVYAHLTVFYGKPQPLGDPVEKGRYRWLVNIKESATGSKSALFFPEVAAPFCYVTQKDPGDDLTVCSVVP